MPRFFTETIDENKGIITGDDAKHIAKVLRMHPGEKLVACDCQGKDYDCVIESLTDKEVELSVEKVYASETEPSVHVTLYQAMPKSDKMELIIQKAVELGAFQIVPVATKRAIVKLDAKKEASKLKRWQAIAEGAAKQSGRMLIPQISEVKTYGEALQMAKELDVNVIPYECARGMAGTREIFGSIQPGMSVGIFIGPEGGWEESEVEKAKEQGVAPVTLGKRILRTETAGLTTLSILMYLLEESN